MSYRFRASDPSVETSVRRIARERLRYAVAALGDRRVDHGERVHTARKELKRLRALIRLVRPAFPAFAEENALFRDTARSLAQFRDSDVMVETAAGLKLPKRVERAVLAHLESHRTGVLKRKAADALCDEVAATLAEAGKRTRGWTIEGDGFDALAGGLEKTLARAGEQLPEALALASEPLHEMRREIKYHAHHLRLIEPAWPATLSARRREAEKLADMLGRRHDLDVLSLKLEAARFGSATLGTAQSAIAAARTGIDDTALPLAQRLLAESPRAFTARVRPLWTLWRGPSPEPFAEAAE